MIIQPRVRGFICVTAHPDGCEANVRQQIEHVRAQAASQGAVQGAKKVLVIGASTGYGLAARITAAFGCGAATLGVMLERAGTAGRPATAGWYNTAAFHRCAGEAGLYARTLNGDAFTDTLKDEVIAAIRADLGQVDQVIYSLAAPRRTDPRTGVTYTSVLKPIGRTVRLRGIDTDKETVQEVELPPATPEEIEATVGVMGGEDWSRWIEALDAAGVLAEGCTTTAFTYVGEALTRDIYWNGSIGAAKKDLDRTVLGLRDRLAARGGDARVAVLKAVVTQASSAIPIMPLYLSLLFKVMKEQGSHEGCIEQIEGLYRDSLHGAAPHLDAEGRIRTDEKEVSPQVQQAVAALWNQVDTANLHQTTDFAGYKAEFLRLFGFGLAGVDYAADTDPRRPIAGVAG